MTTARARLRSRIHVFYAALMTMCFGVPAAAEVKLPVPAVDQSAVARIELNAGDAS